MQKHLQFKTGDRTPISFLPLQNEETFPSNSERNKFGAPYSGAAFPWVFFSWKSWQPVNGGGLFCSSRIPGVPGAAAELWLHFTLPFLSDDLLCFPQFLLFPKMFCSSVRFLIRDTVLICGFFLCREALMRNYCNL